MHFTVPALPVIGRPIPSQDVFDSQHSAGTKQPVPASGTPFPKEPGLPDLPGLLAPFGCTGCGSMQTRGEGALPSARKQPSHIHLGLRGLRLWEEVSAPCPCPCLCLCRARALKRLAVHTPGSLTQQFGKAISMDSRQFRA